MISPPLRCNEAAKPPQLQRSVLLSPGVTHDMSQLGLRIAFIGRIST